MIRALSGVRRDDAYGCMVLLLLADPQESNPWCPNRATTRVSVSNEPKGTVSTRLCDVHEIGLRAEGRLLTSTPLAVLR